MRKRKNGPDVKESGIPMGDFSAPDCVTSVRIGNSILTVSGHLRKDGSATAEDRMMKVMEAEGELFPEDEKEVS
jgi:hypothetical protein